MSKNIAIVGSGFLGLTLALRFSDAGYRVTLFESLPEIGGLASAWQIGDVVWDRHYHVTLLSDTFTRNLIEEVGLTDEFKWVETKTGFYSGGQLISMSNVVEFLKFPLLGLISKFRLGLTILYASRFSNWRSLEKVTAESWLTRLSGKKTFEKIWRPLLKSKLSDAYDETSAVFIWATIQRMYAARRSGLKKEMFGYVSGGYARVLSCFEKIFAQRGIEVVLNSRVETIEKLENGSIKITPAPRPSTEKNSSSETSEFDEVFLTCPSDIAARIVPQLSDGEKRSLDGIRYHGIVCASLLLKKGLSSFYVTNIVEETPFTGIIEMSAIVNKSEFGGLSLVYLPKYVPAADELFDKSDEEIEKLWIDALGKMYTTFSRDDVVAFKVSRARRVFPLLELNYSEKLTSMKTSVDGVFIVNSAHIVNGTLSVNETVQVAEKFFAEYISSK